MKKKAPTGIRFTLKGIALIRAIEAGLVPEREDGGVDESQFEKFWNAFYPELENRDKFYSLKRDTAEIAHIIIASIMTAVLTCAALLL